MSQSPGQSIPSLHGLHVVIVPSWWPSPEQPIAGIFFEDYARAYAAAGAKVGVIFPDLVSLRYFGRARPAPLRHRIEQESVGDIPVIRVRGLHTALGRPALQMRRFRSWLRRGLDVYRASHGAPDILHAMCAIPAGWSCTQLEDKQSRRVILTEHTGPFSLALRPPSAARFVHTAIDTATVVVAVSEHLRQQMHDSGVTREMTVIANPVGPQFIPSAPPKIESSVLRAVFVGRLTEQKGLRELHAAATELAQSEAVSIEWHLVGDGPMVQEIRAVMESKTASALPRFVLHGFCDKDSVARIIGSSHFLLLPSHGENCPLAICEALSIGRPVIGTRGTGCEALIGAGDGELCEIGSVESLAAAVRRLIARLDQWSWQEIGDRARRRFSAEAITAQYSELFRRVIDSSRDG